MKRDAKKCMLFATRKRKELLQESWIKDTLLKVQLLNAPAFQNQDFGKPPPEGLDLCHKEKRTMIAPPACTRSTEAQGKRSFQRSAFQRGKRAQDPNNSYLRISPGKERKDISTPPGRTSAPREVRNQQAAASVSEPAVYACLPTASKEQAVNSDTV